MIYVKDNFFSKSLFEELQAYCRSTPFQEIKAGDKSFLTIPTPTNIVDEISRNVGGLIFSFIRKAHKDFDTDWRIHADNIIQGHKVDIAMVVYLNDDNTVSENGTAFWDHHKHGHKLSKDVSNEEFDRLIKEDSNDCSKWEKTSYVGSKPNRMLLYNANYFHSKYPAKINEGERIVLVAFFKHKAN